MLGALWEPGLREFGGRSGEGAVLVHRECAGRGVNASLRVLALEEPGGYA